LISSVENSQGVYIGVLAARYDIARGRHGFFEVGGEAARRSLGLPKITGELLWISARVNRRDGGKVSA
jgi:hypothetical protein